MRITRRLLLVAAILGALFLGASVVVERIAESRIATEAQRSFHTKQKPAVSIQGFPLLVKILQGEIPSVTLAGKDLVIKDLMIATFRLSLEGVHVTLAVAAGQPIRIERGLAEATVTAASVTAYVRDRGHKVNVAVRRGGVVVTGDVRGAGTGRAEGTPKLVGRLLSFTPDRVSVEGHQLKGAALAAAKRELSFEVDVPELPGGVRITAIEYGSGVATLIARMENATIDLSKA